ncbi:hypothetical protein niasHT_022164 [Heterodera trifolii]|uniref:Uncharacterized protein n=1 Tax=Heterodera trifolii TaxID=157864 RepID=A0ABD2KQX1_9BILA
MTQSAQTERQITVSAVGPTRFGRSKCSRTPWARTNGVGDEQRVGNEVADHRQFRAVSSSRISAMVDSGLGSSNGGSYSPSVPEDDEQQNIDSTTEGQTTKVPLELKRPIAFSFLRRPISAFELSSMAQHRQRLGRQKPKIGQKHSVDSPKSLPELSIHEEMLRFGCENLLTFHYQTEKEKQSK